MLLLKTFENLLYPFIFSSFALLLAIIIVRIRTLGFYSLPKINRRRKESQTTFAGETKRGDDTELQEGEIKEKRLPTDLA